MHTEAINFFLQSPEKLKQYRIWLEEYLKLYGRSQDVIDVYLWAYDYCAKHPDSYDGATMTENLDFFGLEPEAMLHDVLYVALKTAGNLKYQYISDLIIKREMEKHSKSSIETGKRFYLLLLKTPLFVPYAYFFKNRKMTKADKVEMDRLNKLFLKDYTVNWKNDFKWLGVIAFLIVTVFYSLIKWFFHVKHILLTNLNII